MAYLKDTGVLYDLDLDKAEAVSERINVDLKKILL
jgi:hypothetical protein